MLPTVCHLCWNHNWCLISAAGRAKTCLKGYAAAGFRGRAYSLPLKLRN